MFFDFSLCCRVSGRQPQQGEGLHLLRELEHIEDAANISRSMQLNVLDVVLLNSPSLEYLAMTLRQVLNVNCDCYSIYTMQFSHYLWQTSAWKRHVACKERCTAWLIITVFGSFFRGSQAEQRALQSKGLQLKATVMTRYDNWHNLPIMSELLCKPC